MASGSFGLYRSRMNGTALIPLIPDILASFESNDHEIGDSYFECGDDGWSRCNDYVDNIFKYENEGWYIEVLYRCCGEWRETPGDYWTPGDVELVKAWGEVEDVWATYTDESTGEELEFCMDDLPDLLNALNESLRNIA